MTERLYRHPTDRAIAGVAGGLAAWLNIDPSLVRVAWVLLAILSGGIFVLVYIVMMIVVPLPPPGWTPRPRDAGYPGYGGAPGGWSQPNPTTWGPTAAPGGAPTPAQGWGEAPPSSWPETPSTGWGEARDPGGMQAPGGSPTPPPGWGTNPGPAQAPWTAPKPGNAGIVAGVILVSLGVWFLVDQYVRIDWDILWPVVIMVVGGALIAGAIMRGRSS